VHWYVMGGSKHTHGCSERPWAKAVMYLRGSEQRLRGQLHGLNKGACCVSMHATEPFVQGQARKAVREKCFLPSYDVPA
jgi:hypothetical protein